MRPGASGSYQVGLTSDDGSRLKINGKLVTARLRAAGLGEVTLSGNDLSGQMPRQFAGDFAPWLGPWLGAGQALVIPAAMGTTPEAAIPCETE